MANEADEHSLHGRVAIVTAEGTGWDVGHAVVYLASDAARWVTGVLLPVDAGTTAGRISP